MEKYGIDVSSHQGKIDWEKVQMDFAILRAGWSWYQGGMNIDTQFLANVDGVQAAGIPWGVYLYAYDKTPAAARIAANRLADLLDAYQLPYPVYYDMEDPQYFKTPKADNTAICKAFLDTLQTRGYYVGLYTFTSFAKSYLDMEQLSGYDLWIADYTGKVGWTGPYGMWQRSSKGRMEAIGDGKVDVDLNIAYKDYPTIIRATGLNGYGGEGENPSDKDDPAARIAVLEAEKAELKSEKADLLAKIAAAQKALT